MGHEEFLVTLQRTVYTSFVEGMYSDQVPRFSDKCFGDHNLETIKSVHAFKHKVIELDIFNLSMDEAKQVANDVIEMIWSNVDECKMMVPITDAISWCGDNSDKCIHKVGLLDRIQDNFFTIAKELYDIYEIATRDTLCENQTEKLANIGKVVENAARLWAMYDGFDMEFDADKELPKESIKEQYHTAKQKVYDNWPEHKSCPFRPIFDAIHDAKAEMFEKIKAHEPHFEHRNFDYKHYTSAMPELQHYEFHMPPPPMTVLKNMRMEAYNKMPQVQMPNLHLF